MKPKIFAIERPDSEEPDLRQSPDGVYLQLFIGGYADAGYERFDLTVYTIDGFALKVEQEEVVTGRGSLVVKSLDFGLITTFLRNEIENMEADTWPQLVQMIGKYAVHELDESWQL